MIYLFDLDDTLVKTSDLSAIRIAGVDDDSEAYRSSLLSELAKRSDRPIWTENQISELLEIAPLSHDEVNFAAVFTRAPKAYARIVLEEFFPNTRWGAVISYEDVKPHFKPHAYGIKLAREALSQDDVLVIGDGGSDILCAYHGVANVAWYDEPHRSKPDYFSRELLPDFVFSDVDDFLMQMQNPEAHLMCLDFEGNANDGSTGNSRTACCFDPEGKPHYLRVFGKYFPESHLPWKGIRACHQLSSEIMACKDTTAFPSRWLQSINQMIRAQFRYFGRNRPFGRVVLTCIPPRPGRVHRLGSLIEQCEELYREKYGEDQTIFEPYLFEFSNEILSNSKDGLNKADRFENIRKNLKIKKPELLTKQDIVVVVDDVLTTGSSLITAKELLESVGLRHPQLLAMGRTIGNSMPDDLKDVALYDFD